MAKGNGKKKERTRSISLDIDVTEIAQKLADRNELSSTISELLRQAYGFGDKIEEKKRELHALLDEKQRIAAKEADLIAVIDSLEIETVQNKATMLPQLTDRLRILTNRYQRVQMEQNASIDQYTIKKKQNVLNTIQELIDNCKKEMEAFE